MFSLALSIIGLLALVVGLLAFWRVQKEERIPLPKLAVILEAQRRKTLAMLPLYTLFTMFYMGKLFDWWNNPRWIDAIAVPLFLLLLSLAIYSRPSRKRWRKKALAVDFELCPQCGNILKGLPGNHTCPECGTPYDLGEVKKQWDAATR